MSNRVCEVLWIKYPIIQWLMSWLTNAELVVAVSNAGWSGILEPNSGQTEVTGDTYETAEQPRVLIFHNRQKNFFFWNTWCLKITHLDIFFIYTN